MKKSFLSHLILCISTVFMIASCNYENNAHDVLKKNHVVTLFVDGIEYNKIIVDEGDVLIIRNEPQKTNNIFKGWYTDYRCSLLYDFTRPVTADFNLYAGFTLKTKEFYNDGFDLKALSSDYSNNASFGISLSGFDYSFLEKNDFGLQFIISYSVKYQKDYNVLWDIGYAGSPKYELSLLNDSLQGYFEENIPTTTSYVQKSYTYNTGLNFSKGKDIELIFSTDNIQNIIMFRDINMTINVIRLK